ncbi:SDR family oxidoreductase [Arthrobacter sp. TMN-37]
MRRVAVVGGTGAVGSLVTRALLKDGHDVAVLSRRGGLPESPDGARYRRADVSTGEGLREALRGCEALIDVTNAKLRAAQRGTFVEGPARLLEAAAAEGVNRAVLLSIVGIEKSPLPYYQAKLAQEQAYLGAGLETCILRATQFHSFVEAMHSSLRRVGLCPYLSGARFQTIDPAAVADRLVELVPAGTRGHAREVAGPEVRTARQYAADYLRVPGRRGLPLPVPLPGAAGKAFRRGSNLPADPLVLGSTYASWTGAAARD